MCREQCDGCRLNSVHDSESDVCVQSICVAFVSGFKPPLCSLLFRLGSCGLTCHKIAQQYQFNHIAISSFPQKNPVAEQECCLLGSFSEKGLEEFLVFR